MAGRNGQELLSAWVPADVAARFKAQSRAADGGASAALRRFVMQAVGEEGPASPTSAAGHQVTVRLQEAERLALLQAAAERGTTAANWLRSLAIVHLAGRPQWSGDEAETLRAIFVELRRIGNNVNQIARAANAAQPTSEPPSGQGEAVREAAERIRTELKRVGAVVTGNFAYWGMPDEAEPSGVRARGGQGSSPDDAGARRRRLRPRRRPARFLKGEHRT